MLAARGIDLHDHDANSLADESMALAGLTQAAVRGRTALGRRAGRGPLRLGSDPVAPWVDRTGPLQHATADGFDLHAAVRIAAGDRPRLERLCRYLFRPPVGQHRLRRLPDGRVAVALQREWADGTTHLVFEPKELLERLAPLVPRPRINLCLYHGVLAPNSRWRRTVVPPPTQDLLVAPRPASSHPEENPLVGRRARPKYRAWADLMRRAFEADVLACPRCPGRMVLVATIEDPAVIRRILTHLRVPLDGDRPEPAHPPPWDDGAR